MKIQEFNQQDNSLTSCLEESLGSTCFKQWDDIRENIETGAIKLIDLRSPKEFATGHIPYAINIPLLDNSERHEVGLTYKTVGKIEATQLGLELFSEKADEFRIAIEAQVKLGSVIAVHCWRGGMRSQLVGMWLSVMGYKVTILTGGYKGVRKKVLEVLSEAKSDTRKLLVLNGRTGSGKTDIIQALAKENLPVIDLEGIANHRGSVFGGFAQKQASPSQQTFENKLVERLLHFQSAPVIVVEIENYIGPIAVPKTFCQNIYSSDMLLISRDFDERVERLEKIYVDCWDTADEETFVEKMEILRKFLSREQFDQVISSIKERNFAPAISILLSKRYDIVYDKGLKRNQHLVIAEYNISERWEETLEYLRNRLAES